MVFGEAGGELGGGGVDDRAQRADAIAASDHQHRLAVGLEPELAALLLAPLCAPGVLGRPPKLLTNGKAVLHDAVGVDAALESDAFHLLRRHEARVDLAPKPRRVRRAEICADGRKGNRLVCKAVSSLHLERAERAKRRFWQSGWSETTMSGS